MHWIDIGCNLGHESFDGDWREVVARAVDAGVAQMVLTGASVAGSERALALARQDPERLRATAGVHPHLAAEVDDDAIARLRELQADDLIAAVGECGLDYFRDISPRPFRGALSNASWRWARHPENRCFCINATPTTISARC